VCAVWLWWFLKNSDGETDAEHDARLDAQRQAMFVILHFSIWYS
jgi:hypothetical protein